MNAQTVYTATAAERWAWFLVLRELRGLPPWSDDEFSTPDAAQLSIIADQLQQQSRARGGGDFKISRQRPPSNSRSLRLNLRHRRRVTDRLPRALVHDSQVLSVAQRSGLSPSVGWVTKC